MKKLLIGLALALPTSSALAADNGVVFTPGVGGVARSKDVGVGVQLPGVFLSDQTGAFPGAFTTYGTSPGAVLVPSVNAFVTNSPAVTITSGTVTANQGGAPWTVNPGTAANWGVGGTAAAVPANAIYNGMNVAGNLVGLTGTGTSLNVNCTAGCAGSGGTSSNFGSAFPTVGTAIGLTSGTNMVAWSATTNYGTAPAAIAVPGVNAFVTNAAPAGRTANGLSAALASPVVQPSAPNSGATAFPIFSTGATTVGVSIKTTAAVVFGCQLANTSTTLAFVKIYNKASAATVGTDIPVKTLIVPGPAAGGGGSNMNFGPGGIALSTGFSIGITGLAVNSDTTAVASNNVVVNCDYE